MAVQKKKSEHIKSILLQIDVNKPREKRFLDKVEERKQDGLSYKEIFLQCFETVEFKHVPVNTTSTQHVKPVHEKQHKKEIKDINDFDKSKIKYIKPSESKITDDDDVIY